MTRTNGIEGRLCKPILLYIFKLILFSASLRCESNDLKNLIDQDGCKCFNLLNKHSNLYITFKSKKDLIDQSFHFIRNVWRH